jgi:excisionase family DNA binding protein
MVDDEDRLLSVAQVAATLSVTEQTVRMWIRDGKLQAQRAGGRFWRIRQSEVDRMLSGADRPAQAQAGGTRPLSGQQARNLISSLVIGAKEPDDGD